MLRIVAIGKSMAANYRNNASSFKFIMFLFEIKNYIKF